MPPIVLALIAGFSAVLIGSAIIYVFARSRRDAALSTAEQSHVAGYLELRAALIQDLTGLLEESNLRQFVVPDEDRIGIRDLGEPGGLNEWTTIVDYYLVRRTLDTRVQTWQLHFQERPDVTAKAAALQGAFNRLQWLIRPSGVIVPPLPMAGLAALALLTGGLVYRFRGVDDGPVPVLESGRVHISEPTASAGPTSSTAPESSHVPADCMLQRPASMSGNNARITDDAWKCKKPMNGGRFLVNIQGYVAICWGTEEGDYCPLLTTNDLTDQSDESRRNKQRRATVAMRIDYAILAQDNEERVWTFLQDCRLTNNTATVKLGEDYAYLELGSGCKGRKAIEVPANSRVEVRIRGPKCSFGKDHERDCRGATSAAPQSNAFAINLVHSPN